MSKTRAKTGKRGKIYRIELTPLSAMLWAIFLFFSLTWIFILGILVGRGFLPGTFTKISDLKAQVNRLQEMVSDKKVPPSRQQEAADTALKLDFFQELISKKDEVKKNWDKDTLGDLPGEKISPPETETWEKPSVDNKKETPMVPEKGDRAPFISGDQYTVQLASLGEIEKAEKMIQQLIDMGYDAYYYEAVVEGRTFYRIRCGRFKAREDALNYAMKIEKEAGLKGFVSRVE